jgi:hypothetical protein
MQRPRLNLYAEERTRRPIAEVAREMRGQVRIQTLPPTGFQISFVYHDPFITQAVMREFVTKVVTGEIVAQRALAQKFGEDYKYMLDHKLGENVEVLDPSSLPQEPIFPNRVAVGALGGAAGLIAGVMMLVLRRPRGPSMAEAVPAPAV